MVANQNRRQPIYFLIHCPGRFQNFGMIINYRVIEQRESATVFIGCFFCAFDITGSTSRVVGTIDDAAMEKPPAQERSSSGASLVRISNIFEF